MSGTALGVGLALAAVVVACRALARRTGLPYPVFLVVAGAAASFVPHVPELRLDPRLVFLGFLPPLVYHAGFVTSPRELRAHAAPIGLSALGLVLATTFAVAAVVWATPTGFGWAPAFVLGAVVAPTDPVAATAVLKRLGAPARITTILEGESLVNDGIALSLFTLGVAAVSAPTSVGGGALSFLRVAGGGAAFGLVVGWIVSRARRPLVDASSQIVISLLVPFAAYIPADALGLSGVLAALVTGLVLGQQPLAALQPSGRLQAAAFWEVLVFLLESSLFVLVGLQLRFLVADLAGLPRVDIVATTGLTVATVVLVRMAWQLGVPSLRRRPDGRFDTGRVPRAQRLVLGWSGLRGAISLAAALSIPQVVGGRPFPGRELIVFATFSVIVVTLLGQGTTLPWLLRRFNLVGGDAALAEHALAHRRLAEAGLRRLDEWVAGERVSEEVADAVRTIHERRLDASRDHDRGADARPGQNGPSVTEVQRRLLGLQHRILRQLHRDGEISFSVMREIERELDLEQAHLEH